MNAGELRQERQEEERRGGDMEETSGRDAEC